jgi:predicted short-subunit dehydrogenase-like oxidoreductase (DUF2520 family)
VDRRLGRHHKATDRKAVWYPIVELERKAGTALGTRADRTASPGLAIVGAGRVGRSLARAAEQAGVPTRLAGREDALEACRASEVTLLCVPDSAIASACEAIADAIPPLRLVGHTSGASDLDVLAAARARGAEAFSLHPLQTIPDGETEVAGAACAVTGTSAEASEFAARLAERLGMRPFAVPEEHRAAYHAAAVISSNFLIVLKESAAGLLERAGIDDPRELLAPLVLQTAANWAERGPQALTGPIARGDAATVERHLEALRTAAPELVPVYEALAELTRALADELREEEVAA